MRDIIIDFIGVVTITTLAIVFGTNAITEKYNLWAFIVYLGS